MICCIWMLLDELCDRDRNRTLVKVINSSQVWVSPGWIWLLVNHVAMSLSELWNVSPVTKTGLIHTTTEKNTSKVSFQPANHDRDNRKKCIENLWKELSPRCDTLDLKDLSRTVPRINGYTCPLYFDCRNHSIICHLLGPVDLGAARNLNRALITHSAFHSLYQTLLSVQVTWAPLFSAPLKSVAVCDQDLEA